MAELWGAAGDAQQVRPPAGAPVTAFEHVAVVPMDRARVLRDQTVVVQGNRIMALGPARRVRVPAAARVVNGRGKYLIPGLWDMHVHVMNFTEVFFPLLLANGVTGFRDAGTPVPLDTVRQWRRDVVAGRRVGPPRQVLTGDHLNSALGVYPLSCREWRAAHPGTSCLFGFGDHGVGLVITTREQARAVVDSLRAAGADFIKTHDLRESELYFAIAAEARRVGIPFGGHVPGGVSAAEASDSGARFLDHFNSAGLPDVCLPYEAEQIGAPIKLSLAQCAPVAARLRRNGTWVVLTLLPLRWDQGRSAAVVERYRVRVAEELGRYWPDSVRRSSLTGIYDRFVDRTTWPSKQLPMVEDRPTLPPRPAAASPAPTLDVMRRAGMPLVAGTDASALLPYLVPGFSLHAELAMLVAEGLTPFAALQAATLNPARALGVTDSLGTVAPGQLADLVLLDANPLADIRHTTRIRAVMANGRYFDRAALDSMTSDVRTKARALPSPNGEP